MTQYNTFNVKLSNSPVKICNKIWFEVTLNLSSKFLLTNTQVSLLRKAFANNYSANINLSKTKLHKIGQSWGFLGRILGSLLKTGLLLMWNVLKPLAKSY